MAKIAVMDRKGEFLFLPWKNDKPNTGIFYEDSSQFFTSGYEWGKK